MIQKQVNDTREIKILLEIVKKLDKIAGILSASSTTTN